jgi:hypothetical protein
VRRPLPLRPAGRPRAVTWETSDADPLYLRTLRLRASTTTTRDPRAQELRRRAGSAGTSPDSARLLWGESSTATQDPSARPLLELESAIVAPRTHRRSGEKA